MKLIFRKSLKLKSSNFKSISCIKAKILPETDYNSLVWTIFGKRYNSTNRNAGMEVRHDKEELLLTAMAERMNKNEAITDKLIDKLDHETKLKIANLILGSKMNGREYTSFISGRHRRAIAVREVSLTLGMEDSHPADKDGDGKVSTEELEEWLQNVTSNVENIEKVEAPAPENEAKLTSLQKKRLLLISGIPFIGFGFLDNAIMLVAGERIEAQFGVLLGMSTLAAAGFGNLISDIFGLAFGDVVEKWARRLGVKDPKLTVKQMGLRQTKRIQLIASSLGITVGCLLGMVPLLFM